MSKITEKVAAVPVRTPAPRLTPSPNRPIGADQAVVDLFLDIMGQMEVPPRGNSRQS